MKFLGLEISKKLVIGIIAGILVVGGVTTGVILLNNNNGSEKKQEEQTSITLKKDLNFEINSEVKLLSLVDDNSVEVTSDDEAIDTSILGEKEVTIKYLDKNKKEKKQVIKIKIVDTQAPTIEYQKELTTIAGTEIDLLNGVKISDNSKEEIKATIDGTYDFKTEGEYKLKYIAVDSSNNKKEEEFTLKVNKKPTTNTGTNTRPSGNTGSNNNTSNKPNVCKTLEESMEEIKSIVPAQGTVWDHDPKLNKEFSIYNEEFYWRCIEHSSLDGDFKWNTWNVTTDRDFNGQCGSAGCVSSKMLNNALQYLPPKPTRECTAGEKVGTKRLWYFGGVYQIICDNGCCPSYK